MIDEATRQRRFDRRVRTVSQGKGVKTQNVPWRERKKPAKDEHSRAAMYRKLYGSAAWRRLRAVVLMKDRFCRMCQENLSSVVDHIIPHRCNRERFLDIRNLQGLCRKCHTTKTARGW